MNDATLHADERIVGILGGSFNPPHFGHVLLAHYALMRWPLYQILIIPAYKHPFGKQSVAFEHRVAMARLAFQHLGDYIEISEIENELGDTSYTIDTVRALQSRFPGVKFRLVVGGDILGEISKWKESDVLAELAPMLVAPRLIDDKVFGLPGETGALPEISSTEIRKNFEAGYVPVDSVPWKVVEYIKKHSLYVK